jgi:hypothetical protein
MCFTTIIFIQVHGQGPVNITIIQGGPEIYVFTGGINIGFALLALIINR